MPFLVQDEELNKDQNLSGQSAVISQSGQQTKGSPTSSGSYTNLDKYLQANQQQAGQMGEQVAGGVEKSAEQAKTDVADYQKNAGPEIQKATSESVNAALDKPTENVSSYQSVKAGYTGPDSYEKVMGYDTAQKSSTKATENVANLGSEQGRNQLVSQQYARPDYTAGSKKLDTMLVSKDVGSKAKLANVAEKYKGISDLLSGAEKSTGELINKNIATGAANKSLVGQLEQKRVADTKAQLQQQADIENQRNALQQQALSGTINPDTLASLGINQLAAGLSQQDLAKYYTAGTGQAGLGDVATTAQKDYWSNLMNLIGGNEQLGTSDYKAGSFDKAKYESDAAAQLAANQAAQIGKTGNLSNVLNPTTQVDTSAMAHDYSTLDEQAFLDKYQMSKADYTNKYFSAPSGKTLGAQAL